MMTFTELYLRRISESLIDHAMAKGKWMTQAEVERMHLSSYRNGTFWVRRTPQPHDRHGWRVSWSGGVNGVMLRFANDAGKAVTAFERTRREVDRAIDNWNMLPRMTRCDGCGGLEVANDMPSQLPGIHRKLCDRCNERDRESDKRD